MGYSDYTNADIFALTRKRRRQTKRFSAAKPTFEFCRVIRDSTRLLRKKNQTKYRFKLWEEGHRVCYYCPTELTMTLDRFDTLTVEHKTPVSRGGTYAKRNLTAACYACNQAKGSMTEAEFKAHLLTKTDADLDRLEVV